MATRQITLHAGHPRDIAIVDALMDAAFEPRFGEAWTHGQVLGVLAMPGVRLTIATVDEEAAGFALVRTIIDEAELLLLAVAPGFRRRGIGTALLRSIDADIAEAGGKSLHLEVRAGNEAVQLYARNGFAKVGERRAYYRSRGGVAHDAHTYRKSVE